MSPLCLQFHLSYPVWHATLYYKLQLELIHHQWERAWTTMQTIKDRNATIPRAIRALDAFKYLQKYNQNRG